MNGTSTLPRTAPLQVPDWLLAIREWPTKDALPDDPRTPSQLLGTFTIPKNHPLYLPYESSHAVAPVGFLWVPHIMTERRKGQTARRYVRTEYFRRLSWLNIPIDEHSRYGAPRTKWQIKDGRFDLLAFRVFEYTPQDRTIRFSTGIDWKSGPLLHTDSQLCRLDVGDGRTSRIVWTDTGDCQIIPPSLTGLTTEDRAAVIETHRLLATDQRKGHPRWGDTFGSAEDFLATVKNAVRLIHEQGQDPSFSNVAQYLTYRANFIATGDPDRQLRRLLRNAYTTFEEVRKEALLAL